MRAQRAAAPRASIGHPRAASARASRLRPKACAAPPKKYARRWSGRSSARPAPGRGRYRRSRRRAARGPGDRAAAPTTSAARRVAGLRPRIIFQPSFDFEARDALFSGAGFMAKAGHQMVVDHAGGLHEGIDDGRADEFESARGQFFRYLDRQRRRRRHAGRGLEVIDLRPAVDEIPQEFREARAVLHDLQIAVRAGDRALDLGAVADDAGVVHQRMQLFGVVARDLFRDEIVEGAAKVVALAQDRDPRQPGLKTVEDELFVQRAVIIFRHAPFGVVIGHIERIFAGPWTPHQAIGMQARRPRHATVCFGAISKSLGSATRMARPPNVSGSPAASASATRSTLISARPWGPAAEPMVPTDLSPARMAAPGSGDWPSRMIRNVLAPAVPTCCIPVTTSCPTSQALSESTP